jgi:hypothetical protein
MRKQVLLSLSLMMIIGCNAGGQNGPGNNQQQDAGGRHQSGGPLCQPCSADSDCGQGNTCVTDSSGRGACGTGCQHNNDCPSNFACYPIFDSNQNFLSSACLPANNGSCFNGNNNNNNPDAGTQQGPDAGSNPTGMTPCTNDTWGGYAQAFMNSNCVACHAMYNGFSAVETDSLRIRNDVSSGRMPTGATLQQSDIQRFDRWIDCDLPP